jgi:uncharacterized integral membrane protein (TIGR00697 family)
MKELIWIVFSLTTLTCIIILAKRWGVGVIMSLVVACIIMANILASKIIYMFGFTVPAGVIVYALSFLLTDTLSEFYGKKHAVRAVFLGFIGNILFFAFTFIALKWPNAFGPDADAPFQTVLSMSFRITFAALITYLISQFHDVFAYDFWAKKTKGKHLFIRNNLSTLVSQTIDTFLFITISFWGIMPIKPLIIGQLVIKAIIAILDTASLYILKKWVFSAKEYHIYKG